MKKTKIVASISDFNCDVEFLTALYEAGMNVVRINTAHANEEGIRKVVNNVRKVSDKIGILIDTKGPEIRTTTCSAPITYHTGERVRIYGRPGVETTHDEISVSYPHFAEDVTLGKDVLFDDGELDMRVVACEGDHLVCEVMNDGELGSRKSVNVPGVHINLPALTEKDMQNLKLAVDLKLDFVAHSFVRSKDDVVAVKTILDLYGSDIKIISKIENQEGVDHIDEIIDISYGIMVARGDLGIEVPIHEIPGIQRAIISKCVAAQTPVIVATQMLHTMINNPRPTRAEVSDIASAVYAHTDALMLSGETAKGKYPVEAVRTMAAIAEAAEKSNTVNPVLLPITESSTIMQYLCKSAIDSTKLMNVKAVITDSNTGRTALSMAAYRCGFPVVAVCYREPLQRQLSLSFGITAIYQPNGDTPRSGYKQAMRMLLEDHKLSREDAVAYLTSPVFGTTNSQTGATVMELNQVGNVI